MQPDDAPRDWWLIGNRHFGLSTARGASAKDAKGWTRDNIAESFEETGHSPSAARRGASSYAVFVVAGNLTRDEAQAARDAWHRSDCEPAEKARRAYRAHLARLRRERGRAR